MSIQLALNGKYTLISISDFLATTTKQEITITRTAPIGRFIYKNKGKRKEYYLPQDEKDMLLFEGHSLPLLVDSETNRFMGNAKFNFVTDDPDKLKVFIEQRCLNPDPEKFHKIRVTPTDRNAIDGEGEPLFPEAQTQEG